MIGPSLALASAAFFGLNNATVRRGVIKSTVMQGMAITVPLGIPIFAGFALALGGFEAVKSWEVSAWVWMAAAGVTHFVIGRYGNYRATQALGGTLSTPIQQLSILVSLFLAFIFLEETLNTVNVLGLLLVMMGPMLVIRRRSTVTKAGKAKGFEPEFGAGILWGCVCAVGYGASPLMIAFGLGAAPVMADGIAGVFVSYLAATVVVAGIILAAGGRRYMATLDKQTTGWFLMSALFVALSQLFRYMALTVAPVSVVVPIQRLSVVFRMLFNAILNKDHEIFDAWVVASIFLAILGAIALTVDSSALLGFFGVSDELVVVLIAPLY